MYYSSNPVHDEVYSIQYYVTKFISNFTFHKCRPLLYTSCEMEYIAKIDIECCMNTQQLSATIYVVSHAVPRLDKYRSSIYNM